MNQTPFLKNVERASIAGVEVILNCDNGAMVGLTEAGADVVDKLANGMIDLEQARAEEPSLLMHLERANFFGANDVTDIPLTIYFHVTQRCNLKCVGCYSVNDLRNHIADVPYDVVCDGLSKLKNLPVESITFSGGEPFLRQDIVGILRHAKAYCKFPMVRVITNGLVLDTETISNVAPYVDEIAVSFDGFSENAHSWIRGNQNYTALSSVVQTIKQAGIQPHVISTIHSKNIDDIDMCRKFAGDLAVPYHFSLFSCDASQPTAKELVFNDSALADLCNKILFVKNKEGKTSLDLVSALRAKRTCGCGRSNLSVGHDGDVFPCHMLHNDEYSMGNLYTDFDDGKDLYSAIRGRKPCEVDVDKIERCKDCEFRYVCGGGCRARSVFAFGDLNKWDPYCVLMRKYYEKVFSGLSS